MIHLSRLKCSGTKKYSLLTADSDHELERMAERLGETVHGKGNQAKHLDLNEKKRRLAIQLGAQEEEGE